MNKFTVIVPPKMRNKTFRLSDELLNKLDKIAKSNNISVNQLIIQCCNYALNQMEDKK